MLPSDKYEVVIGLEVHAQLLTNSKLFSGDSTVFGSEPNSHISPIVLAYPGTLPKLNKAAVQLAVKLGIACNCEIEQVNYFARKNYFYPDLPKGYQISQHTTPICKGGYIAIRTETGEKDILLNRIHLEEDAGKSIHDTDENNTYVDYNRAGVALVEIVTEPCISSSEEAYVYVTALRKLVRYLDVCDGNMEEGSLRCDANISIRPKGSTTLGTKVEVKNLNSIRYIKKAIDYEVARMITLKENGEDIIQQTRSFDAGSGTTFAMRTKEEANDYRYFPDPDLPPFVVTSEQVEVIKRNMPVLPDELVKKYIDEFSLSEYDARTICDDAGSIAYFEQVMQYTPHAKPVANWLLGPVRSYLNEHDTTIEGFPLMPSRLAELINMTEEGTLNFSIASSRIMPLMISNENKNAISLATELNLLQDSDSGNIARWIDEALASMPDKVSEYKKGKKGLAGLFMGEIKKISKGKADPKIAMQLLAEKLDK